MNDSSVQEQYQKCWKGQTEVHGESIPNDENVVE